MSYVAGEGREGNETGGKGNGRAIGKRVGLFIYETGRASYASDG